MDNLEEIVYYPTRVYAILKPEFLEAVHAVSEKYLDLSKSSEQQQSPHTTMTAPYDHEPDLAYFGQYVSQTAWNIHASQGYAMDQLVTFFTEMWTQEHRFSSSMNTHVHPRGSQISAFYFLEVPEKSGHMVIHDPRPGKVMINLFPADLTKVSDATDGIVLTPQVGMLVFTNAWLPHSFTRNDDEKSMKFVHMNLGVMPNIIKPEPTVEII